MLIPGFPNYDLDAMTLEIRNVNTGLIRKCQLAMGYWQVGLCCDGKHTTRTLAYWMALCFIPNPENKPTVDHINRVKTDDRLENLRWATHEEQQCNKRELSKNNTSGVKGVSWSKTSKKWCAEMSVSNKRMKLGRFDDIEDAKRAYLDKLVEVGRI